MPSRWPLGGVNINDYISNGHNRSATEERMAAASGLFLRHQRRRGARDLRRHRPLLRSRPVRDLQVEQTKSVLSAANPVLQHADPSPCTSGVNRLATPTTRRTWTSATLQALVAPGQIPARKSTCINNNLKAPYSDQFSIGMRNSVGDWNTSAAIAEIRSHDGLVFTLGNRYPDGGFWQNGSQPWGNGIPGLRQPDHRQQRHGDANHAVAAVGGEALHEGIALGRDHRLHLHRMPSQNRDINDPTDSTRSTYATIGHYPFINSRRAPSTAWSSPATSTARGASSSAAS